MDPRQLDGVDLIHKTAEYRPLATASGYRAAAEFVVEIRRHLASHDRHRVRVPVHLHGNQVLEPLHQPLVAQIADGEQLRLPAEGHQGDHFAFVQIQR